MKIYCKRMGLARLTGLVDLSALSWPILGQYIGLCHAAPANSETRVRYRYTSTGIWEYLLIETSLCSPILLYDSSD